MDKVQHDCNKYIHGYFVDFDISGWHNLCGAGHCYLCHCRFGGRCPDYKEGKVPDGVNPM